MMLALNLINMMLNKSTHFMTAKDKTVHRFLASEFSFCLAVNLPVQLRQLLLSCYWLTASSFLVSGCQSSFLIRKKGFLFRLQIRKFEVIVLGYPLPARILKICFKPRDWKECETRRRREARSGRRESEVLPPRWSSRNWRVEASLLLPQRPSLLTSHLGRRI